MQVWKHEWSAWNINENTESLGMTSCRKKVQVASRGFGFCRKLYFRIQKLPGEFSADVFESQKDLSIVLFSILQRVLRFRFSIKVIYFQGHLLPEIFWKCSNFVKFRSPVSFRSLILSRASDWTSLFVLLCSYFNWLSKWEVSCLNKDIRCPAWRQLRRSSDVNGSLGLISSKNSFIHEWCMKIGTMFTVHRLCMEIWSIQVPANISNVAKCVTMMITSRKISNFPLYMNAVVHSHF